MPERFEDRVVVVTGAAGGMGRTLAQRFGREGARLVVTDIDDVLLDETVEVLKGEQIACASDIVDLTDESAIQAFGAKLCAEYGAIDVLLNNGACVYGEVNQTFETMSQEKWLKYLAINTVSPLLMAQALRPALAAAKGVVINQSSMISFSPMNCYSVTKAALNAMTHAMAQAFAKDAIRVNAVAPGIMETPAGLQGLPKETWAQIRGTQLTGEVGTPEHIADLTLFLASDEGRFINCEVVACDAGSRVRGWRY
jgi:3-oxoacyl-[acyl-carrier protein] reductase